MLELYFRPMACSLASRIALEEAGIEARYRSVDFLTKRVSDDGADFHAIAPKATVPVLVLDGRTLTENAAVLQCIADMNPAANLAPAPGDPERYRLQEWLSFVGTELHKSYLFPFYRADTPDAVKEHQRKRVPEILAIAATRLRESTWLLGDRFSVADAYLIWALLLTRFSGVELDASLEAYLKRALERPATARAIAVERGLLQGAQ